MSLKYRHYDLFLKDESVLARSNRVSKNLKQEDLDLNSYDYKKEGKN